MVTVRFWPGSAMSLGRFNRLTTQQSLELLQGCLAVDRWTHTIEARRPYRRLDDLFEVAREAAFPFSAAELEAALATLKPPDVVPQAKPGEGVVDARIRQQLAAGTEQYQRRFGRRFLLRAEGKSDAQVLVALWERLGHDIDTEDRVLAQQVREIALVALAQLVSA